MVDTRPLLQSVCGKYPGGARRYAYVPERCRRIAPKTTPTPRKKAQALEMGVLARILARDPHLLGPPPALPPDQKPTPELLGMEYLGQAPNFLVFAVDRFRRLRTEHPDPDERYALVCKGWPHADCRKDLRLKAATIRLANPTSTPR